MDDMNISTSDMSCEKSSGELTPLLKTQESGTAVYTRRWYLLLLFSFSSLMWMLIWASWGPISESSQAAFQWSDSNIAMFIWCGNVPFAVVCIPLSWLMDHKGLRISVILSCTLMAAGAGVRCISSTVSDTTTWLVYFGQFLNGIAGPVSQGGASLFSNLWFPPGQRATATAISTFIGYMGSGLAFLLGPALVSSPGDNSSSISNQSWSTHLKMPDDDTTPNDSVPTDYPEIRSEIMNYLYYQAGAAGLLLLLVVVYFPDKPPCPPSISASVEREEFKPGLAKLIRNQQFWLTALAYSLPMGVFEVWDAVLDVNLGAIGISEKTAGWMGFSCIIGGCVTGLVMSKFADIFFRQVKLFMIIFFMVSAVFILWFILIYIEILPFDIVSIYAAVILSGLFLDGSSPIFYEMVCEAAFPVGEGVSCCFLQMMLVFVGILFTSIQQIPNIGTTWMNWCLFGVICASIPLLILMKQTFSRADLDEQEIVVPDPNPSTQTEYGLQKERLTYDSPISV